MKKELTIECLAPYLPYGLKFQSGHFLVGLYNGKSDVTRPLLMSEVKNGPIDWEANFNMDKPILRPLPDLTRRIMHNGETFIPMVKLAEIAGLNTMKIVLNAMPLDGIFTAGIRCNIENDFDGHQYEVLTFDMQSGFGKHYRPSKKWDIVPNQLKLWQMLHAWHFDLYSLLESNLAINFNTIE